MNTLITFFGNNYADICWQQLGSFIVLPHIDISIPTEVKKEKSLDIINI